MRRMLFLLAGFVFAAGRPADIPFEMKMLDGGANESCAFADINGDGKLDIVAGENWYSAPTWRKTKFRELYYSNNYIDSFSDLPIDVDGDGKIDIVTVTWFSKKISWYRNPGLAKMPWVETVIDEIAPHEFGFLVDMDNDGKARELLPQAGGAKAPLSWYEIVDKKWVKRPVAAQSYGHGIGAGDVNGDGRTDILTPKGWLEAPADPRSNGWTMHNEWTEESTGFLYVIDINGDKQLDLLTGKRFMAHNGKDPGEREPLGVYWYEWMKTKDGKIEWVKHIVEYASRAGGGMQMPAADLDGDGDIDFAAPGKSGLFLFTNLTKGRP
ncbi:MAG: VCBS repeat-containing protein [Bryobacter sp.]|nr:VCBS repeat-containing protein [Bryobacter sp.]